MNDAGARTTVFYIPFLVNSVQGSFPTWMMILLDSTSELRPSVNSKSVERDVRASQYWNLRFFESQPSSRYWTEAQDYGSLASALKVVTCNLVR